MDDGNRHEERMAAALRVKSEAQALGQRAEQLAGLTGRVRRRVDEWIARAEFPSRAELEPRRNRLERAARAKNADASRLLVALDKLLGTLD
ncbi:MAG: hypothetical protein AAF682_07355 [Planctomycetota bacterium]